MFKYIVVTFIVKYNGDFYLFKHSNIMERVKQMKVDRFEIVSDKLIVIKVKGVINE